ncbi:thymidylate kinase [Scheffersomyces xylosifermentans]|uniref:thymidylate kinase n=1 Tax=Scheffersomyces xylosifermentans TaxID=1304137 RepID=UPI00315CD6BD
MTRGQLILIEGLDRTGKSTQSAIIAGKLGKSKLMKFPDRTTKIGGIINEYLTDSSFQLSDQSAHLLFSANRWELNNEIIDLLNKGYFIVLDRYIYSGIAYSLAKYEYSKSVQNSGTKSTAIASTTASEQMGDVEWLYCPDKGLPKPDLTMFLTMDLEELGNRKGWGDERYELQEFQKIVKSSFMRVLHHEEDDSVEIVDVNGKGIEAVTELLWNLIQKKGVNELTDKQIEKLR